MPALRKLDRYVFGEFARLFLVAVLGFPLLVDITDLAQRIEELLNRNIPARDIALSYWYWTPDSMFMVMPAAVLVATVFAISGLARHAELTAAKASGISFHRLTAPILLGAVAAFALDLGLGALAPASNKERSRLLREDAALAGTTRSNFVFAGGDGRVYKALELRTDSGVIRGLQVERRGRTAAYPTYLLSAQSARYAAGAWRLTRGDMSIVSAANAAMLVSFAGGIDRRFFVQPRDLMEKPRQPHDMTYGELTRIIDATERSGGDANLLRVERALKIAVPATCLIIALFGAPLAMSSPRGGSGYGVAASLATTMIFLVLVQLTRAIGAKGVIPPDVAAWMPGALFGAAGVVMLVRVQT